MQLDDSLQILQGTKKKNQNFKFIFNFKIWKNKKIEEINILETISGNSSNIEVIIL